VDVCNSKENTLKTFVPMTSKNSASVGTFVLLLAVIMLNFIHCLKE
jgi:hypothetical protein